MGFYKLEIEKLMCDIEKVLTFKRDVIKNKLIDEIEKIVEKSK